ncbi:membrane protein [Streptomyces yaizuensis]|uniref:Membrane protein n=2 Tax=Streptomyces yaizuensis TaxID=2989713 RepID=A0ABQ5P173_9ACTN|nr:membrane protein [Streptomyces sp. YSPA8]
MTMFWPMLAVALGFLGIAVLGVLGVRVFLEARRLGQEVARTAERIDRAAGDLERAAAGLARGADTLRRD